ncbi:MAG: cache domain-containing protein [Desulfuromonadaceae bacterium]|nr:cache domain-containing protein [Desulfuromonadaceae bacterium]
MKKLCTVVAIFVSLCFSMNVWASQSATKDECVLKCREAAAFINSKGLAAAIKEIGDPKGTFVWKDTYVFLMNLDGKMLAHPMQPELTQLAHCLLITDPTDKAIFVSFVNTARNEGQGWVEYLWPKPGKKSPSKKITYVYRVPGKDLFVAAGIYVGGMMY